MTYAAFILASCRRHPAVDPALVAAVLQHESRGDPRAYRGEPEDGDGSIGLMQILLATARAHGYTGPVGQAADLSGLYDPATNIEYGTADLAMRLAQAQGRIPNALSAYNGGWRPALGFGEPARYAVTVCLAHDPVTGRCQQWHRTPPGAFSNQAYVDSVLALYHPTGGPG